MIFWCGTCGMEDTQDHKACSTCGSALQRADMEWLAVGETADETVFELELENMERAALIDALIKANIRHRWDDTHELVVKDEDADAVEPILDEIYGVDDGEFADAPTDEDEFDDLHSSAGGDEGYEVLSELFVATDKLLKKRDVERLVDFREVVEAVLETANPFGVEAETWADIQSAARNAMVALDENPKAPIDADLKGLYNQLQLLV